MPEETCSIWNKAKGQDLVVKARSVKWVPEISGNIVEKSKLPPQNGSSLEAVKPHP